MQNGIRSVFFEVINSSVTSLCSIIKRTFYYSVYMRTSGKKVRISDEAERVIFSIQDHCQGYIRWCV